jgi:ABC-2 type transport system permease protein
MAVTPLLAMVRKDLQLFLSDRRSVIVSFVVPIAIASFFGSVFSGTGNSGESARIDIAIVDHDSSPISRGVVTGAQADKNLRVTSRAEQEARDAVNRGDLPVAVIIPKGFGDAAGSAFFNNGEKPAVDFLYDPSRSMELAMVRGVMTQHVMEAVSREMFGGEQGRAIVDRTLPQIESSTTMDPEQKKLLGDLLGSVQRYNSQPIDPAAASDAAPRGITMPYTVREQAMTSGANVAYNGYAHSFGGMAIQFLLFAMANLGVEMLLERRRGLWKRFRSAPVSKVTLLAGKAASGAIISLAILLVCFAFAMIVFGVRIQGSIAGFFAIVLASSLMASTFGLLVAALGNSPATARGMTTLAVLMMVMLGGAWVPTFVFPAWLQQFTQVIPVRWAVDGLDAMTWRGQGLSAAVAPTLVLCGFGMVFAIVAAVRFRWEET